MSLEDNKTIARRFLEECILQGKMDVLDTSFAPDLVVHFYGTPPHSHASYKALTHQAHQALSGQTITIGDLIAEGDRVAMRFSYTATTHHSHMGKDPPTGHPVQVEVMHFYRFELSTQSSSILVSNERSSANASFAAKRTRRDCGSCSSSIRRRMATSGMLRRTLPNA